MVYRGPPRGGGRAPAPCLMVISTQHLASQKSQSQLLRFRIAMFLPVKQQRQVKGAQTFGNKTSLRFLGGAISNRSVSAVSKSQRFRNAKTQHCQSCGAQCKASKQHNKERKHHKSRRTCLESSPGALCWQTLKVQCDSTILAESITK